MSNNTPILNPLSRMLNVVSGLASRKDGWYNVFTGLGVMNKDSRLGADIRWEPLTETDAEHIGTKDPIGRRVVWWPAREGTRKWITITASNDTNPEIAKAVASEHDRLQSKKKLRQVWGWSRMYGGAAVFIAVDDGLPLEEPLDLGRIRKVNAINVLSKHELSPHGFEKDLGSPNFGLPTHYQISPRGGSEQQLVLIHHTRLIRFDGLPMGRILFQINRRWGDSALNSLYEALRDWNLAQGSTANAIQDFRIGILKLKNLAAMIGADKDNAILKRIQLMRTSKSIMSAIALDADAEDYEYRDGKMQGVAAVLERIDKRLVAATEMPHTVILGEGATGTLGGGGQSEDRMLSKFVHGLQEEHLEEPINRLNEIIMSARQGPTAGKIIDDITWDFVPLWQPTDKENAEVHEIQSKADKTYWEIGAVDGTEIRNARFSGEEFSTETQLEAVEVQTPTAKPVGETVQEGQDQDDPEEQPFENHAHTDPLDSTVTGPAIGLEGSNHVHRRANGTDTGPAINLPNGFHIHEIGSDPGNFTGVDVPIEPSTDGPRLDAEHADFIRKVGNQWFVFSETGRQLSGPFSTEAEAKGRLQQIEYFKASKKGK